MPAPLLSIPTGAQLDQARAAIPALEAALARFAAMHPTENTEQELALLALAEEIAAPLFGENALLFRQLLRAESAATPRADASRREYLAALADAPFCPLNGESLLRLTLALFCAATGAPSDYLAGEELAPSLPPPPPGPTRLWHAPSAAQVSEARAFIPAIDSALDAYEKAADQSAADAAAHTLCEPILQKVYGLFRDLAEAELAAAIARAEAILTPYIADAGKREHLASQFDRVLLMRLCVACEFSIGSAPYILCYARDLFAHAAGVPPCQARLVRSIPQP